jgi:ABC-2 type transport system ATP-binding protein
MKKTILISSHILPELSDFCTSIGIIEKGKLVASGSLADIEARINSARHFRVTSLDPLEGLQPYMKERGIECTLEDGGLEFDSGMNDEETAALLADLVRAGYRITSFAPVAANLEDLFMKITRGEVA